MKIDQARDLILSAVAAIPRGAVASYGVIGERAGLKRSARMVAKVLSQLPDGSEVPWFRVLRAGGRIAFAPGSDSFRRQRKLLEAEGCEVGDDGRVRTARKDVSLDALLWGPMMGDGE